MRRRTFLRVGLAACVAPWLLTTGCARSAATVRLQGRTMGTTYGIEVVDSPVAQTELAAAVEEVLEQVNRALSTYDAGSEISALNRARSGEWIEVSAILYETVMQAREISALTDGAFDISVAPLLQLWGLAPGVDAPAAWPSEASIAAARRRVGYRLLELRRSPRALRKLEPTLELDVDAIAPGLAVDLIAARFEALGAGRYLVELGGEIRGRGHNGAGRPWRVAVETPLAGERRAYAAIEFDTLSVSTSGDYRDWRLIGGRRVSHVLDPRSGLPLTHGLSSVTVLDARAVRADAMSTALMVMGPDAGFDWAQSRGIAALFVTRGADATLHERQTTAFAGHRRAL